MARDFKSIKKQITDTFIGNSTIKTHYGLTDGLTFEEQFSIVSIENILFDIVAFFLFVHEQIVEKNAENSRPQNVPNFKAMVLSYIDGVPLIHDGSSFVFDTTGVTDIEDRKIIKQCAVLENKKGIVVKVATEVDGVLQPVTVDQATRVFLYIDKNTQPGVPLRLINEPADELKLNLTVYVDPLVIDLTTGKQLNVSGDVYPVKDAIQSYLTNLEFNGGFVKNYFNNTIEDAAGVKLATINSLECKYASLPFTDLGIYKIPNAGHFKIDDSNLTITYLSHAVLG